MKPHRLPSAGRGISLGVLLLAQATVAAPILPPLYRGGVNLGSNGAQVSQGVAWWKDTIYVGVEAQTCYPNQPQSSATVFAVDVSNPTNLQYVTKSSFGGCKAYGLAVFEDKLYVANWSELHGVTCERCHGDQGKADAPHAFAVNRVSGESRDVWGPRIARVGRRPGEGMKMSDCIDCHEERGRETSCLACHK